MIRIYFLAAFLLAIVTTVACGPSGSQNIVLDNDQGEHVDSEENELYDYDDLYEDEYEYEYEEDHEEDDEEDHEDMHDWTDEEEDGYVVLPDWFDTDLDQLSMDRISMLSSAKNNTQLLTSLGLTKEQQNQMEEEGPIEVGSRSVGDNGLEFAGCKPQLEVVKLEPPPNIVYFPQCVRLPRCGGCCTGNLLSCQHTSTKSIKIKVTQIKTSHRSRRSTHRRERNRRALAKYVMVNEVEHLDCTCQCHIKEKDCDKSIQEYEESECGCVCKNRDKEAECVTKITHTWDHKSCSCMCKTTRECSTGEKFSQTKCRCVNDIRVRSFQNTNVCDSYCVNGEPKECSCKEGWRGERCDKRCNCIPIHKCEPLFRLAIRDRSNETLKMLKEASCDNNPSAPKVCCPPLRHINATSKHGGEMEQQQSLLPSYCGQPARVIDRIFGGKEVKMGQYPWMAILRATDISYPGEESYICGGSLINKRYVLTAAHCVKNIGFKILTSVVLGEFDQSTEKDCDENNLCLAAPLVYRPEKVIVHPKYDTRGDKSDDIALIRLDASVDIDDVSTIHAVCLPGPSFDVRKKLRLSRKKREKGELSVAGWGFKEDYTGSDKLLEVELPLQKFSKCNETYGGILVSGQICAGGRVGQDSCGGDSGGPLMFHVHNSTTQVGVVSFGPTKCGRKHVPGVYTHVSKYMRWIEMNLEP